MESIGARIKFIRKSHGLNQISFAQSLEISQGTLSELEKKKFNPSVEQSYNYIKNSKWISTGFCWVRRDNEIANYMQRVEGAS